MAQAMASMAGLHCFSQAIATTNNNCIVVSKSSFTVKSQQQQVLAKPETSRRGVLGLIVFGMASGSFVQAVLTESKSIKFGPPPPPSSGLFGTLNSDELRDLDLPSYNH